MILPFVSLSVNILIPDNTTIKEGSTCHIDISITIKINSSNTQDKVGIVIDQSFLKVALSVISP